jgi:hypothetical protein
MSSRILFSNHRSAGAEYLIFINKWVGFGQSFSIVLAGGDMYGKNQISVRYRYIEIIAKIHKFHVCYGYLRFLTVSKLPII